VLAEGALYHVTSRGNARMCVYTDDDDRNRFLDDLQRVVDQYRLACHAYCLMSNHYHLILQTCDANLSSAVRQLNGPYAQWWNRRCKRVGHVWQGRFKAQLIQQDGHFLEACRYVVLNPVRAGMVARAEDWPWSSYRGTAGLAPRPRFLTTSVILGHGDQTARQEYRDFVLAGVPASPVTEAVRQDVRIIGTATFAGGFRRQLDDGHPTEVPRRERRLGRPSLECILDGSHDKRTRDERIREARARHHYDLSEIAAFVGLHYCTVSRICAPGGDGRSGGGPEREPTSARARSEPQPEE
jgi:REP element-mobilizing transposase RayT